MTATLPDAATRAPSVLLVEDNRAEADLVVEYLADGALAATVHRATTVADARTRLCDAEVDVVLLDLTLPDASGVESVARLSAVTSEVPIVILTGVDDESLALRCIEAGATDYLVKAELKPHALRRAIGYALSRRHEGRVRELTRTVDQLRQLSTSEAEAPLTAILAGVGSLRSRQAERFEEFTTRYAALLETYLKFLIFDHPKPQDAMEVLATQLGDHDAGPRDLLDVHMAALEEAARSETVRQNHAQILEGRLLALELMGLLVDYYRSGHRRRFLSREAT
jgi:DNA-binding response OmpR family regulator